MSTIQTCLWQICSVDTMKTSRDNARAELYNPNYDDHIREEMSIVKYLGANYVTVDTPYDKEFLPYLRRWVAAARSEGLHVWFRGNWSSWEGWFDYPKNMTPSEHIKKTADFIRTNDDLFEDGDIFDSCPECENAGYWPQPQTDQDYADFIIKQHLSLKESFAVIGKDVRSDLPSIIGGRAKDVLGKRTFDALGNTITIDHYIDHPSKMGSYINYFSNKFNTKVLVSEFGAPIPDLNGNMTEKEQAAFINDIYFELYKNHKNVVGVNYWVLYKGTTALLNLDMSSRLALETVRTYFKPSIIEGRVVNTLGESTEGVTVRTKDTYSSTTTDKDGNFRLLVPAVTNTTKLLTADPDFITSEKDVTLGVGKSLTSDFIIAPKNETLYYKLRKLLQKVN